jgi:hypothetical protein
MFIVFVRRSLGDESQCIFIKHGQDHMHQIITSQAKTSIPTKITKKKQTPNSYKILQ